MAKQPATIFVCQNCGSQSRKFFGICPDCGEPGTAVEERFRPTAQSVGGLGVGYALSYRETKPVPYSEIESQDDARTSSGIDEFDRVLGGGIVAGSLVLIGGAPGIGKSTIVIQMADKLSRSGTKVLYVSGEESERQIKMRGERLGVRRRKPFSAAGNESSGDSRRNRQAASPISSSSIRSRRFSAKRSSPPRAASRRSARSPAQFMMFAKQTATPVFLTGHVTKEGSIAGPENA